MKFTILFILFVSSFGFSQNEKNEREKFPTTFAVQLRGLTNNRVVEGPFELNNDTVISTLNMRNGFSFGGVIRRQFTDNLGIEIGLIHNKRFYNISGNILDTNSILSSEMAFTNYEIPVNGLAFIKFSKTIYASAGLGFTMVYKPSSILKQVVDRQFDKRFVFAGLTDGNKFGFNINAQFGVEFRTERMGTFYVGGAASIPTNPLFEFVSAYTDEEGGIETYQSVDVRSPYFAIDLRYYFPKIRNKGVQPIQGPIE